MIYKCPVYTGRRKKAFANPCHMIQNFKQAEYNSVVELLGE